MIKNIAKGYQKLFFSAVKLLALILFCTLIGFAFVFPLWKWASSSPSSYTIACIVCIFLVLAYIAFASLKKLGLKRWLFTLAKLLTIASGLSIAILSVLKGNRILALATIPIAFIIYGLLSFGAKHK